MLERLTALQERARPLINKGRAAASEIMADEALKREIDVLYRHYYGRAVTGCKNCYCDALVELCNINKATAMSKTELFVVRRGKVLKDTVNNDARLNLVRGNETEELALYHLYTNPGSRKFFEKLPDEALLNEMLIRYGKEYEAQRNQEQGKSDTEADGLLNDAKAEASAILVEAEEKAKVMIAEAGEKADAIIAEAENSAREIIERAKQTVSSSEGTAKTEVGADVPKTDADKGKKKAANATSDPILK